MGNRSYNPYNWRYPVNSPVEGTVVYPIIYKFLAYVPGGCFLGFLVAINSTCHPTIPKPFLFQAALGKRFSLFGALQFESDAPWTSPRKVWSKGEGPRTS